MWAQRGAPTGCRSKFRIVLPLATPFTIMKEAPTQREAINKWKRKLIGLSIALGVPIDESCLDPSRLFYTPRHRKGGQWTIAITGGEPLDMALVPEVDPKKREEVSDPFLSAGKELGGGRDGDDLLVGEVNLKAWAAKHAEGFQIAQLFHAYAAERIRGEREEGKIEVECPFDGEHNNPGDTDDRGTYCADAHSNANEGGFRFHCQHNACSNRDRLQMLAEALRQGWFPLEALEEDQFDAILPDAEPEDEDAPSEIKWHDVMKRAKAYKPETETEEIEQLLRDAHHATTSRLKIDRLIDVLVDQAKLKRTALRDLCKEIREEVGNASLLNQSVAERTKAFVKHHKLDLKGKDALLLTGLSCGEEAEGIGC